MKKTLIFSLIILLLIPFSNADWFYNSRNVLVNVDIKGEAEIRKLAPNGYIDTATINLTFFPKEYETQELLNFDTSPEAEVTDKAAKYTWKRPENDVSFGLDADVKTINVMPQIREKIGFPIGELPEDIVAYTKPSETIDAGNDGIIRIASELVAGEDDLYAAVFKIAGWTKNNIEYNLSTLTAEVSQKSSWVLENRQGVCDELTSLFIAMLRAVGIPARFVSGISFTNSPLFPEQWGAHGWAEVYFPDAGWVPFDVTYGEFGYVDPTHIKLKESIDSDEVSTQYRWLARNIDLETKKLDIKADLFNIIGKVENPVSIKANILKDNAGFGSYNIVEAQLENLKDYYLSTEIILSKTKELEVIGSHAKQVLLLPKEKKSVYWLLKVTDDLERNFIYTFPVSVNSLRNSSGEAIFKASEKDIVYSLEEMQEILKQKEEEIKKIYSRNVDLNCNIDKNEFYEYEGALMTCNVKNTGNVFLKDLNVCYSECEKIDLGIGRETVIDFIVKEKSGKKDIIVKAGNNDVSKTTNVEFNVLDEPLINIINIKNPYEASFEDVFEIEFELDKASESNPIDVDIAFRQNSFAEAWTVQELFESRKFVIKLDGKSLKEGKNSFNILVKYKDENNRDYESTASFDIFLVNLTLLQKAQIAFFQLNKSLENMTVRTAILLMAGIGSIFILVVMYVFRKRS